MMRRILLHAARMLGLFALCRWITRGQQRILCYHGIWTGPPPHYGDCLFMSPARFADRMAWLKAQGYGVITLDEACDRLRDGSVRSRDIVITIDDAWAGIVAHMLPVLRRHGMPATLYVTTYYALAQRPVLNVLLGYLVEHASRRPDAATLGVNGDLPAQQLAAALAARVDALPDLPTRWAETNRLAESFGVDMDKLLSHGAFMLMSPSQIRAARENGVDIQLHTHTHRLHDFGAESVQRELALNRQHLAHMLHRPPAEFRHFCYPSGEYDPRVFPVLRAAGIASATTTDSGLNEPGAELLALKRILDCESMADIDLEARLSGFWSVATHLRRRVSPGRSGAPVASATENNA